MADLKPAYLIQGDDDVKIDAWRTRLRARAEREARHRFARAARPRRRSGEAVAEAIGALTLAVGRRYVLAEGVERWKEKDVAPVAAALKGLPPDTIVVLIATGKVTKRQGKGRTGAREAREGRRRRPAARCRRTAPRRPGGCPPGSLERGKELGLAVDRDAAQALVERIGPNQRRLVRELEKLVDLRAGRGRVDVELVEELTRPRRRGEGLRAGRRGDRRRPRPRARARRGPRGARRRDHAHPVRAAATHARHAPRLGDDRVGRHEPSDVAAALGLRRLDGQAARPRGPARPTASGSSASRPASPTSTTPSAAAATSTPTPRSR